MVHFLFSNDINEELLKPGNSKIINIYRNMEFKKIDSDILQKFPESESNVLRRFLKPGSLKNELDEEKKFVKKLSILKNITALVNEIRFQDLSNISPELIIPSRVFLETQMSFLQKYRQFSLHRDSFYMNLVNSTRSFAEHNLIGYQTIFRNEQYFTDVFRKVFNTKMGAELFFDVSNDYRLFLVGSKQQLVTTSKRLFKNSDFSNNLFQELPDVDLIRKFNLYFWEHKQTELNKIYSTN